MFNDKISQFIPPKGGNNHFFTLVDLLSKPEIYEGGSNFGNALRFLLDYVSKSIDAVFLISDFLKVRENVLDNLFLVAHKFETVGIMVKDLLDITLPNVNKEIVVEDPLSGQQILINPSKVKEIYEKFKLCYCELATSEKKISRSDFIPEAFSDLRDSERKFYSHCTDDIFEIEKHSLCCFSPQVSIN